MFAVLLAAATLGDPNANPVLYERLTERVVIAMRFAAKRHPRRAAHLQGLANFMRLDADCERAAAGRPADVESFLFNCLATYQQVVALADELSDPVLDLRLLAALPPLVSGRAASHRAICGRSGCSLQGVAMWYLYRRAVQPAVGRVVGYTAALASRRF